ncbi:MAG: 2-oxo acid dehydrogenase subunit E2 [Spirochaetaceae bacterium]|jgi:pyruvate dehydrogenase E2 component (dihydrolipoamide acetyltransferase)|nr:2-oxo acid dehydrogenase subunit E2 [Spirochaetaceae bacterium]
MANSIIMPKTGMAMEEGVIVEWLVKEGDRVQKGDVVAVIETDKTTMDLESDYDGVILAVMGKAGETVPVTRPIAWVGEPGEPVPKAREEAGAPPAVRAEAPPPAREEAPRSGTGGGIRATPAARKAARDRGIDLGSLKAGGKYGEVRLADMEVCCAKATPLARRMAEDRGLSLEGLRGSGHAGKVFSADLPAPERERGARPDVRVPLTGIQRVTGRRMLESRQTIPDVTEHTRADVTRMLELRKELNEQPGLRITVNDFALAAAARALEINPRMNSVLDGNDLVCRGSVNLGVAVATERGLLVPVIRDAQGLGLRQISAKAAELAARAREGKLSADEMGGGTFTVSNVGMYGITLFTPIINPPEAAILGVCAIEDELRLAGDKVLNRKLMGLSLSFDHRIADGAVSALFLKTIKDLLESPLLILA